MVLRLSTVDAKEFEPKLKAGFKWINGGSATPVTSAVYPNLSLRKANVCEEASALAFYVTDPANVKDAWSYLFVRPKTIGDHDVYEAYAAYTEPEHRGKGLSTALHFVAVEHLGRPLASDEKGMTDSAHKLWTSSGHPWQIYLLNKVTGTIGAVPEERSDYFTIAGHWKETVLLLDIR